MWGEEWECSETVIMPGEDRYEQLQDQYSFMKDLFGKFEITMDKEKVRMIKRWCWCYNPECKKGQVGNKQKAISAGYMTVQGCKDRIQNHVETSMAACHKGDQRDTKDTILDSIADQEQDLIVAQEEFWELDDVEAWHLRNKAQGAKRPPAPAKAGGSSGSGGDGGAVQARPAAKHKSGPAPPAHAPGAQPVQQQQAAVVQQSALAQPGALPLQLAVPASVALGAIGLRSDPATMQILNSSSILACDL